MRGGCARVCVFVRARFHSDVCVSHSVCVCGLLTPRLMHPVVSYDGGETKPQQGNLFLLRRGL